uniref:Uncharacterized protein n=1 Tax=Sus scrofa TaxID=9823 RepID=A0A8D0N6I3_PIG
MEPHFPSSRGPIIARPGCRVGKPIGPALKRELPQQLPPHNPSRCGTVDTRTDPTSSALQAGGASLAGGRAALPVPDAGGDESVGRQSPGRPQAHTAEQEGGCQVAEAEADPPGSDAMLPGQVDPVQRGPAGLR